MSVRRVALGALAAATLLAGWPTTAESAQTLTWGACQDPGLVQGGAECAVLQVPLDHEKPRGTKIPIALSRIKASATGADYLGPLLWNPGGPGSAGLDGSVDLAALLSPAVAGRFDLIGFDPRGVGESGPDLRCDAGYYRRPAPDYVPSDPARVTGTEKLRLDQARAYVRACAANSGGALAHMRTIDAARDLDLIRGALGSPRLSYIGNSYGTYLGQVYATQFPGRVARMVLTGVVPPDGAGYTGDVSRPLVARAYERNIQAFFDWVARYDAVFGLGTDGAAVEKQFYADQDELRAAPRGVIGPAEWTQLFGTVVYGDENWALLAQGWSAWNAGRSGLFESAFADYDATDADDFNAGYLAIACSDGRWPRNYDRLRADSLRSARDAPYIAWAFHWELSVLCSSWPSTGAPVKVGSAVPSILFVNSSNDAPTPFSDALRSRAAFPRSALIEVTDSLRHAGRTLWGNACAQGPVEAYLASGALPPRTSGAGPDLQCGGAPLPGYPEIALAVVAETAAPVLPLLDLIAPR
jgi:pimeloyl-ACP methyl ester carboxylesterase